MTGYDPGNWVSIPFVGSGHRAVFGPSHEDGEGAGMSSAMAGQASGGGLHDRMGRAAGDRTYRSLGAMTNTHPETVRRYMQGQAPSVEFLAAMCHALGISGEWMLTGSGPMRLSEAKAHALRHADPSELLSAMAGNIEGLDDRLGRLEVFVQTLESRVRGEQEAQSYEPGTRALIEAKRSEWGGPGGTSERAQRIGAAIAHASRQRPPAR